MLALDTLTSNRLRLIIRKEFKINQNIHMLTGLGVSDPWWMSAPEGAVGAVRRSGGALKRLVGKGALKLRVTGWVSVSPPVRPPRPASRWLALEYGAPFSESPVAKDHCAGCKKYEECIDLRDKKRLLLTQLDPPARGRVESSRDGTP